MYLLLLHVGSHQWLLAKSCEIPSLLGQHRLCFIKTSWIPTPFAWSRDSCCSNQVQTPKSTSTKCWNHEFSRWTPTILTVHFPVFRGSTSLDLEEIRGNPHFFASISRLRQTRVAFLASAVNFAGAPPSVFVRTRSGRGVDVRVTRGTGAWFFSNDMWSVSCKPCSIAEWNVVIYSK